MARSEAGRPFASPLREGDRVRSVVAVLADITEEFFFDRLKRELLAALAHELKSPVAIVKGYTQHFLGRPEAPPAWRPKLLATERAANRLERLIDDLIQVSGLTLGQLVFAREQVELCSLTRSVAERAVRGATPHRVEVHAEPPVVVMADRARIETAISRLVDNALRYSPAGSEVRIDIRKDDQNAVLSVRDQGIGIPMELQGHVFETFFRAHAGTSHDVGGLGIGLFLAREIVLRHGGAMWFESVPERGSTFYLRLPLMAAA